MRFPRARAPRAKPVPMISSPKPIKLFPRQATIAMHFELWALPPGLQQLFGLISFPAVPFHLAGFLLDDDDGLVRANSFLAALHHEIFIALDIDLNEVDSIEIEMIQRKHGNVFAVSDMSAAGAAFEKLQSNRINPIAQCAMMYLIIARTFHVQVQACDMFGYRLETDHAFEHSRQMHCPQTDMHADVDGTTPLLGIINGGNQFFVLISPFAADLLAHFQHLHQMLLAVGKPDAVNAFQSACSFAHIAGGCACTLCVSGRWIRQISE